MLAVRSSAKVGGVQLDCWRRVESERKCRSEERKMGKRHLGKGQPREPLPDPRICHVAASWPCWLRPRSRWSCETMGLVAPLAVRQHSECMGANSTVRFVHNAGKWRVVQLDSMAAALSPREELLPTSALRCTHCCPVLRKREREGGEERCGERGRAGIGGGGGARGGGGGGGGLGRLHASRIVDKAEGLATWQGPRKEEQGVLKTITESVQGGGGRVVGARSGQEGLRLLLSSHVTCNNGGKRGGWSGSRAGAVVKSFSLSTSDFNRAVDYRLLTWQVRRCDTSAKWVAEASPFGWSWWRQNRRADGGEKEEEKKRGETDKEVRIRRQVKVTRVERSADGGVIFTFGSTDGRNPPAQGLDPLIAFVLEDRRRMEKGGGSLHHPHRNHDEDDDDDHHQVQSAVDVTAKPAHGADDASGPSSASDSDSDSDSARGPAAAASDEHNERRTNVHRHGLEASSDVTVSFAHDYDASEDASGPDSGSDSSSSGPSLGGAASDESSVNRRKG